MGKIIKYDFRKSERHREYEAIQDRIFQRTLEQIKDSNYYLKPEVQEAVSRDAALCKQLEEEAEEAGDNLWED